MVTLGNVNVTKRNNLLGPYPTKIKSSSVNKDWVRKLGALGKGAQGKSGIGWKKRKVKGVLF